MGLIHLVGSYCEWFNISVVGCRDLVPDIDHYTRCLDESVTEYFALLETTGQKDASAPAKKVDRRR
jgi:hypothetical protein